VQSRKRIPGSEERERHGAKQKENPRIRREALPVEKQQEKVINS
jgi:hypothetical protein